MADSPIVENDFLSQLTSIVEKNIAKEQFGVSELADEMNMSRSNLLRKVKKLTNLSVSQLISQVRLKRAMELLKKSSYNVSEVSLQVGFGSTSYFIKCFREFYGYPPGEVSKREEAGLSTEPVPSENIAGDKKRKLLILSGSVVAALLIALVAYLTWPTSSSKALEKSIAVLPFKNESNDSSNVYLINGLMESTLSNLQKIKDLRVISRTSVERYRNTSRSMPELAKELNVTYFVEGSGQKIGDHILLNIQLIDGSNDRHLWAKQYRREAKDIFALQQEIARNIADEIEVIITPEEKKRIEKNPTEDLVAYDLFLKGKELFYQSKAESLRASIPYFLQAIEHDNKFALAYANAVMVYYYLDVFQIDKKYQREVNNFADKAMLYDSKLAESLIAKALAFANSKQYDFAVQYLEKALEYDPHSGLVLHFLTEFYSIHISNPGKYLEYALMGAKSIIPSQDSAATSFRYFHLSNAFIQAGFIDEALDYINRSLDYNPQNYFSNYVKPLFEYAKNRDLKLTRALVEKEFEKDTSRIDIVQELGRLCYSMRDYKASYRYYKKFVDMRERQHMELFKNMDLNISIVYEKMGFKEKSQELLKKYKQFADEDKSIYKPLYEAMYFARLNDKQKAIENLKLFAERDNFQYWILLLDSEPLVDGIKNDPEYKAVMEEIESKFWARKEKIREHLEEEGLL
jgi:TolB-like protein/AraC-like DNA-binding protein